MKTTAWECLMIQGVLLVLALVVSAAPDPLEPFNRYRQKIPRIGRRGEGVAAEFMDSDTYPHEGSLSNFFLKSSKAVPRLGRRKDLSIASLAKDGVSRPWTNRFHYITETNDDADNDSSGKYEMSSWPEFALSEDAAQGKTGIGIGESGSTLHGPEHLCLSNQNTPELFRKWILQLNGDPLVP